VQYQVTYKPDVSKNPSFTSSYAYNSWGHLTSVQVNDGRPRSISFVNDMAGQVLSRTESDNKPEADPSQHYYYFGGKLMGSNGNNGNGRPDFTTALAETTQAPATGNATRAFRAGAQGNGQSGTLTDGSSANPFADFDQAYEPVSTGSFGGGAQSWTVKQGETLEGIAQNLWGDASLWYMLAQENGIRSSAELRAGQLLQVPNRLANVHNTSDTFRPYDASQAIGDTQPTTPKPPKKPKCGVFGQILLTVIAIAVTILAAPTIGILPAAVLGSAVSQGVGIALGIQDKFSFKQLGIAAVAAVVTAGVGAVLGQGAIAGSQIVGDVIRGAISSAATQGISVATGLQEKFSWVGVAAAGVAAGVGGAVSRGLSAGKGSYQADGSWKWNTNPTTGVAYKPSFGTELVSGVAGGIASAATRSLIEGTNFGDNLIAGLPDVIGGLLGRTLGNEVVGESGGTNRLFGPAKSNQPVAAPQANPGPSDEDRAVQADARARTADELRWRAEFRTYSLRNVHFYGADGPFGGGNVTSTLPSPTPPQSDSNETVGTEEIIVTATIEEDSWFERNILKPAGRLLGVEVPEFSYRTYGDSFRFSATYGRDTSLVVQGDNRSGVGLSGRFTSGRDTLGVNLQARQQGGRYIVRADGDARVGSTSARGTALVEVDRTGATRVLAAGAAEGRRGSASFEVQVAATKDSAVATVTGAATLDNTTIAGNAGIAVSSNSAQAVVQATLQSDNVTMTIGAGAQANENGFLANGSLGVRVGDQSVLMQGSLGYSDGNLAVAGRMSGTVGGITFDRSGSAGIDNVGTRAMGLLQAGGGALEVAGGTTLAVAGVFGEPVTLGASTVAVVGGGAIALMGADNVQAGLRTAFTGQSTNTMGARLISNMTGMSMNNAELTYGGIQLATGVGAPAAYRSMAANGVARLGSAEAALARSADQVNDVRRYADGSLRTADGRFASAAGAAAPGTRSAENFADFLRNNGTDVVGTELSVRTPVGIRRYDIVTRNTDGSLFGLEIKTGGATPNAYQRFSDMYVNRFGATGTGVIRGQQVTGAQTVYLPTGY
jgi:hypothetical protein